MITVGPLIAWIFVQKYIVLCEIMLLGIWVYISKCMSQKLRYFEELHYFDYKIECFETENKTALEWICAVWVHIIQFSLCCFLDQIWNFFCCNIFITKKFQKWQECFLPIFMLWYTLIKFFLLLFARKCNSMYVF